MLGRGTPTPRPAVEALSHGAARAGIWLNPSEGGTGAAPLPLLAVLRAAHGLEGRIRPIASGKLGHPGDVAWARAAGAEFVTSARGFMVALGCIQAPKCNRNSCPAGITPHDPRLQRGLGTEARPDKVARHAQGVLAEPGMIAQSVGVADPRTAPPPCAHRAAQRPVGPDGLPPSRRRTPATAPQRSVGHIP